MLEAEVSAFKKKKKELYVTCILSCVNLNGPISSPNHCPNPGGLDRCRVFCVTERQTLNLRSVSFNAGPNLFIDYSSEARRREIRAEAQFRGDGGIVRGKAARKGKQVS